MPQKKFAWSWSRLKNYRTCPKRHYHLDIAKDIKEEESEEVKWGHVFHKAMADRISKLKPLLPTLSQYEAWPALISNYMADAECNMALTEEFKPTAWFSDQTWLRAVVDVRMVNHDTGKALAIDWKTGKIQPDYEQLAITAQMIFSTYPDVHTVDTAYVWSRYDDATIETYTRDALVPLWNKLLPEVKQMEQASIALHYPPKPSGLCKHYCPVTSCPHHGIGTLR